MPRRLDEVLGARLAALAKQDRLRSRVARSHRGAQIDWDGRRLLNFCANDYLGLAADNQIDAAAAAGSGASSLVTGYSPELHELEAALADWLGRERALVFSSGFAANVGIIDALIGRDDLAVADALNHASLIDGVRLSGAQKAIFDHRNVAAAKAELDGRAQEHALLVSDHVFSMDGDIADARGLADAAAQTNAWLMLDDAHGLGVLGADGRGVAAELDQAALPILVGTLGKSVGAAGAFVAGSVTLIDYLINRARSQVFSTAMPPVLASTALAGLRQVISDDWRRAALHGRIAQFRAGAAARGLPVTASDTPIQPLVVGADADALAMSAVLADHGVLVSAIRPPTVPEGTARLRITLSAAHTAAQVDQLLEALDQAYAAIGPQTMAANAR